MQIPIEVYFHNTAKSDLVEDAVRERARKLERYADLIVSCRVTIEAPHKHQHQGKLFHVTIDLHVPGEHIVVSRDPSQHQAHEDATVAIRDAFDAARRKLQDYVRVRRGKIKSHEEQPRGTIVELNLENDFGRIETADGREIYFHRNSVLNADFESLETGMRVAFDEERGDKGPQASTVHLLS